MNITEQIKKADELVHKCPYSAFRIYMEIIDFYRSNRKRIEVDGRILTAYNNAVVVGLYIVNDRNDLVEMRNLAIEFVKVAKKSKDSRMYAIACFHAGIAHNALGEYDKAVKQLEEALTVFELLGDDEGVMLACKNLAEAYRGLGYVDKYEVYIGRAKALAEKCGDEGLKEVDRLFKTWKLVPWVLR